MVVFAIIVNWNDPTDTLECVSSIRTQKSSYKLNIVVVDNGSSDNSLEILSKEKDITVIPNKINLGYTGGNNTGIDYAMERGADYVWIINPDLKLHKDCLANLIYTSNKYPKHGIVSPKIYFYPGYEFHKDRYLKKDLGKVLWYAGGRINWSIILGEHFGVDEVDEGQYNSDKLIEFATGSCLFIRKEVINKLKGFDDRYFLYLEDADLSISTRNLGYEICFSYKSIAWHKNAKSSGVGGGLQDYYIARNRLLFGEKFGSIRQKSALMRESIRLVFSGRKWQKTGVKDYYLRRFGRGSYNPEKYHT